MDRVPFVALLAVELGAFEAVQWYIGWVPTPTRPDGWNALSFERRRAVRSAVVHGKAVEGTRAESDLAAQLALRLVVRQWDWHSWSLATVLLAAGVGCTGAALANSRPGLGVEGAVALCLGALAILRGLRRARRLETAVAVNSERAAMLQAT